MPVLRLLAVLATALLAAGVAWLGLAPDVEQPRPPAVDARESAPPPRPAAPARPSLALGRPDAGRLVRGVQLPVAGPDHVTWDPVRKRLPNRGWRRWGTDRLVRVVLAVLAAHRAAHPSAPRVLVGDLSRPRGGDFGPRFGSVGHASHQNGLDVDVYLPRRDRRLRAPRGAAQVARARAQDLVDRFVAAGARFVFVGPGTGLRGPPAVVQPLPLHDDHLHVRLPAPGSG